MVAKKSWSVGQLALLVVVVGAVAGLVVVVVLLLLPGGRPAPAGAPAAPVAAPALATTAPSCADEAAPFLGQIQPLAREWDDANKLASSTPRAALAAQIEKLQALRRKTEDLEAPNCAAGIKQPLVATMEGTTQGFIAFLGQKPEKDVNALFAMATEQHGLFDAAMLQLKAGKPVPPAELLFRDGIGIDRATIQKAYPAFTFAKIGDDPYLFMGMVEEDAIEMVGPADNLLVATITLYMTGGSGDRLNIVTKSLHTFLKVTTPDWDGGDAWLSAAMKDGLPTIATHGRVVSYERSSGGTDTFTLTIRVP